MTRKRVPLKVQLEAALLQLGLDPKDAELDHDPALELRQRTADDYDPAANDPHYLVWRSRTDHMHKTFRDNGSGRSDIATIAHSKRVIEKEIEFQRRMLAKGTTTKRQTKWPSRPFQRRKRPCR